MTNVNTLRFMLAHNNRWSPKCRIHFTRRNQTRGGEQHHIRDFARGARPRCPRESPGNLECRRSSHVSTTRTLSLNRPTSRRTVATCVTSLKYRKAVKKRSAICAPFIHQGILPVPITFRPTQQCIFGWPNGWQQHLSTRVGGACQKKGRIQGKPLETGRSCGQQGGGAGGSTGDERVTFAPAGPDG